MYIVIFVNGCYSWLIVYRLFVIKHGCLNSLGETVVQQQDGLPFP